MLFLLAQKIKIAHDFFVTHIEHSLLFSDFFFIATNWRFSIVNRLLITFGVDLNNGVDVTMPAVMRLHIRF